MFLIFFYNRDFTSFSVILLLHVNVNKKFFTIKKKPVDLKLWKVRENSCFNLKFNLRRGNRKTYFKINTAVGFAKCAWHTAGHYRKLILCRAARSWKPWDGKPTVFTFHFTFNNYFLQIKKESAFFNSFSRKLLCLLRLVSNIFFHSKS